jgi:serine phosphatase RsbU (regulator of sigma subunit)
MGHGLREASLMAAMRVAFHAYAIEDLPAHAVVERVDRLFTRLAPDHLATAVLVMLDIGGHQLNVVNAGHPSPVRIDPSGRAELIEDGRSLPLGVRPDDGRPEAAPVAIGPGTKLLLYTDGLTERIDRAGGDGEAAVLEALDGFRGSVDALCERVLAALLPERSGDDTCLLALGIE